MKTFKLLPHGWQTAGWIVTGMGAGLMLWGAFMDDGTHDFIFSSMWAIGGALWTISFLILAFSQEQYEDERIRSIRMNTLGITAIIYAAMIFLYPVMDFTCLHLTNGIIGPKEMGILTNIRGIFLKPLVIYVLLFKFFLWKENRSLKYEEEV